MIRAIGKLVLALQVVALLVPAGAWARAQTAVDPNYLEARRLFDALDYEGAVRALDLAIAALQGNTADPAQVGQLTGAYDMRARAKFGLGDSDGAAADFVSLLKLHPDYTLTGQVSPRLVALFDATAAAHVTSLGLSVTPASAKVMLDGAPVQPGTSRVAVGDHVISVDQPAYRPVRQTFTAAAGQVATVSLTLDRVSSTLRILTSPINVEVTLDGAPLGKTAAGPLPAEYSQALAQANLTSDAVSTPLSVPTIAAGAHVLNFSLPCHAGVSVPLTVDKPDDYTVGPIVMKSATGGLSVTTAKPGALVFLNGDSRGSTPFSVPSLCEGDYVLDVRSATGSFRSTVTLKTGDDLHLTAVLRPAFALASSTSRGDAAGTDVRLLVERALARSQSVLVFAPPADQAKAAVDANRLPADWLAFDGNGRSLSASGQMVETLRSDASKKLADAFHAQGVAAVTLLPDNRIILALLAAGSSTPDLVQIDLSQPQSIANAIEKLDREPSLFRPALGLTAIDVADVTGAVVVGVDPKIAASGIQVGDLIVAANGKPLASASALTALLADRAANDSIALDLTTPDGAKKQAKLAVFMTPRLISLFDPTVLANRDLLEFRVQLAGSGLDATTESVVRLNEAVALARLGDWASARDELRKVHLPAGTGVGDGTVQYFLGLAESNVGSVADAVAALKRAAAAGGLVTEDGPSVSDLATAKITELQAHPQ